MRRQRYTLAEYAFVLIQTVCLSCMAAAWLVDARMRATASFEPDPTTAHVVLLGVPKPVPLYVRDSDIALFRWLIAGALACAVINLVIAFGTGMFESEKGSDNRG